MADIASYNASYPLAYYNIGTVYSFYGTKLSLNTVRASDEQVRKYSGVLKKLDAESAGGDTASAGAHGGYSYSTNRMSRYYGVVVGKSSSGSSQNITVMFMNCNGDDVSFLLRRYIVSGSCATDGKELMAVSTSASIYVPSVSSASVIGGITRLKPGNDVTGGITRAHNDEPQSSSIGGITRVADKDTPSSNSVQGQNAEDKPVVGGITRLKQKSEPIVGGITRLKSNDKPIVGGITKIKP